MIDPKIVAKLERLLQEAEKTILPGVQAQDQQAFQTGFSFHIAALRCGEVRRIGTVDVMVSSPMIVNFAFAIELYLKSLLLSSNGNRRGHDLEDLFSRLKDTDREEIEKRFETLSGRTSKDLAADLTVYRRAFEEWRYIYETNRRTKIAVYSLADLARSCFLVISERNVNWANQVVRDLLSDEPPTDSVAIISLGGGVMLRGSI